MMKIALFGATRGVGFQVLQQALDQGHTVHALVRNPAKMSVTHQNLVVFPGDVRQPEPVSACVAGCDAVVCALGTAQGDEPVEAVGTRTILQAMQAHGVRRIAVVTSLGVGDSKDQVPMFFKMLMKTALRKAMAAKEEQERLVRESGLDWTIVRPGGLTNGPATGTYAFGMDKSLVAGQVARADVAEFVLRQLTDDTYLRQAPAIT